MFDFVSILLKWLGLAPDSSPWKQVLDNPPLPVSETHEIPETDSTDLGAIITPDG